MSSIEIHCVTCIQALHCFRKIGIWSFTLKMVMIGHKTESMYNQMIAANHLMEIRKK